MSRKLRTWLHGARLVLLRLEDRTLPASSLSASLSQGILRIEGTDKADTIRLHQNSGTITVDGVGGKFPARQIRLVDIRALGDDDLVYLRGHGAGDAVTLNGVRVDGGAGSDTLVGGLGNDQLFGSDGNDQIFGMAGDDYLDGGAGDDMVDGGDGLDTVYGDAGNDGLFGGPGNDKIAGGDGTDYLRGDAGNDWLDGGRGTDTLLGDGGVDLLYDDAVGNVLSMDSQDLRWTGHFDWFDQAFSDPGLRRVTRWFASDGVIDREDILRVFGQAESASSVSSAEFSDLQAVVAPAWSLSGNVPNIQWYGMPDSVLKLATSVIDGDAANARYQGAALGSLHAGSSSADLDKLVSKWFLGTDHPQASSATYRLVSGDLFQNGPSYRDVDQGNVGDCYFVAALAEVAQQSPELIRSMFVNNGDGTFTVRFFVDGAVKYVTVDRYLPTNSSGREVYAAFGGRYDSARNELWVALAEKAYVQLNESGGLGHPATNAYSAIDGGYSDLALGHITNRNAAWTWLSYATESQLVAAATAGPATVLGSKQSNAGNGVVSSHAYALVGWNGTTRKFALYNPWGSTLELTWAQIIQSFNGYWQVGE